MEKYYTPQEVASSLKVGLMTVYRWIKDDKLKAVRLGRVLRIPESELRRLLGEDENA